MTPAPFADAEGDSYTDGRAPNSSRGLSSFLVTEGGYASPQYRAFLKFTVSGRQNPVQSAVLRLYAVDGSTSGGAVYAVPNNYRSSDVPWTETGLTRANEPLVTGSPVAYIGAVSAGTFVDLDVTSAVPGNGTFSFAIVQSGSDAAMYRSRQGSVPDQRPRLIVVTARSSARTLWVTAGPYSTMIIGTAQNGTTVK